MSDPVSNADIEDVLSSIRRLVSVDGRSDRPEDAPTKRSIAPVDMSPVASPKHDIEEHDDAQHTRSEETKLVLTPSFRVSETSDQDAAEQDAASAEDAALESLTLEQWQVAPASPSGSEASEDESALPDEEDAPGKDDWHAEDVAMDEDRSHEWDGAEIGTPDIEDESWEAGLGETDAPDDGADDGHMDDGETGEDGVGDAVMRAKDAALEDVAEQDATDTVNRPVEGFAFVDAAPAEDDVASAEEVAEPEEIAEDDSPTREPASELEARIAEVEAAVAAREDQWEPDGEAQDEYAGGPTKPLPWEDHAPEFVADDKAPLDLGAAAAAVSQVEDVSVEDPVEPAMPDETPNVEAQDVETGDEVPEPAMASPSEPEQELQPETGAASGERAETDWYSEDAVLDEDALRDLVSEIVRQELQGTLGERITRNVRKLVRREIHRAMMGQDLD
ncbi:MAG: hypothetical protein AAFW87_10885 [Pseudomonadota bacterium]